MSSNDLIDLMREYGVRVGMLGTLEEPRPEEVRMGDMLLEIHRLRTALAGERVRVIEELIVAAYALPHEFYRVSEGLSYNEGENVGDWLRSQIDFDPAATDAREGGG